MAQWYCCVGGRRHGPIPEEVLRRWIAEGRVGPGDYVWTAGMVNWALAGSIPSLLGAEARSAVRGRTPVPPPGGSGGRMGVGRILAAAWRCMRGRWGLAIGFALLLWLLQMGGAMVQLILGGPLALGGAIFFLTYVRGGNAEIGMLFAGFRNFGNSLLALLLMTVFVWLGIIAAVIPGVLVGVAVGLASQPEAGLVVGGILVALGSVIAGVVLGLMFSQTFYLLADDPSLGPMEAVKRSVDVMRGNKLRLFGLWLILMLAGLVCNVVICVGWVAALVFMAPFVAVCQAIFHDDLHLPVARAETVLPPSAGAGPVLEAVEGPDRDGAAPAAGPVEA